MLNTSQMGSYAPKAIRMAGKNLGSGAARHACLTRRRPLVCGNVKEDKLKRLSRKDLESIADRVIKAYMKLPEIAGYPVFRIYPEILAEKLLGLKVDYRHLSTDGSILGLTSYGEAGLELPRCDAVGEIYHLDGKTVLIESDLRESVEQEGRKNFTIMHEVSHHILKMLFPRDYGVKPQKRPVHFCRVNTIRREDWEEWQSNALASCMLLPRRLVEQAMRLFDVEGGIRILNQVFAKEDYDRFVGMTELLGCSRTALSIRMKQLGYIEKDYLDDPYRLLDVEEY